jgi:hypothetical protein
VEQQQQGYLLNFRGMGCIFLNYLDYGWLGMWAPSCNDVCMIPIMIHQPTSVSSHQNFIASCKLNSIEYRIWHLATNYDLPQLKLISPRKLVWFQIEMACKWVSLTLVGHNIPCLLTGQSDIGLTKHPMSLWLMQLLWQCNIPIDTSS